MPLKYLQASGNFKDVVAQKFSFILKFSKGFVYFIYADRILTGELWGE